MTKERLSKLQKWILTNSYRVKSNKVITVMRKVDIFRYFKATYTLAGQEFPIINNFKAFMSDKEYNKVNATISRSLRNLKSKGYVRLIGHKMTSVPNFEAIEKDIGKFSTKEEYMEATKSQDMTKMMSGIDKWFQKMDLVVEVDKNVPHKTKLVELTEKGVQRAKELLGLISVKSENLTVIELPAPKTRDANG